MNTFAHMPAYPTAEMREVVRANFDTLYSLGWPDLTQGPVIVSVPDTNGRFYLLPMLDMWTDVFAYPGKLTTGTGAGFGANLPEHSIFPQNLGDADGNPLTGANRYVLSFPKGAQPPAGAFWSLTVYDGRTQLLVANPINRYLINSPMLPELEKDEDGELTLFLQYDEPAAERAANWQPLPDGPFYAMLRMYWPQEPVLDGEWQAPAMQPAA